MPINLAADLRVEERTLDGGRGVELFSLRISGEKVLGGAVVLPGFGDHHGRYLELAGLLARRGFAVWVMDQRGNGRSGGRRGHVDRFEDYPTDLDLLTRRMKREGEPLSLLAGQSMGGLVAIDWLSSRKPRLPLLMLFSPFLALAMPVSPVKLVAAKVCSWLWPTLAFASDIRPEHLSHDPEVAAQDQADPLLDHKVTPRWFRETGQAQARVMEAADGLVVDALLLAYGAKDPIASPAAMGEFYKRLKVADRTEKVYPDRLHELLRESNRKEVLADLAAWLTPRLAKLFPAA